MITTEKHNVYWLIGIAIVLIIVSVAIGYYIGTTQAKSDQPAKSKTDNSQSSTVRTNSIFTGQSAVIVGTVTDVSGKNLTIKNKDGKIDEFAAEGTLTTYDPDGAQSASGSAALKSIVLNRLSSIVLQLKDNKYQVTSIGYFPNTSPVSSSVPPPGAS